MEKEKKVQEIIPTVVENQETPEEKKGGTEQPQISNPAPEFPEEIPILPLRGLVVYPETAVPLTIGQPRSIRLIDDVMANDDRLIGLVASRIV